MVKEKAASVDFSLTKEELEERLLALDATGQDFAPSGSFAMCYAPIRSVRKTVSKICEGCGKRIHIAARSWSYSNSLTDYQLIARKYCSWGFDAQIFYYCDKCVNKRSLPGLEDGPTNVFFGFKAKEAEEYHLTPLNQAGGDTTELEMVLEFLKGAESYQELDKDFRFSRFFSSADDFRKCVERVLGLGEGQ